MAETEAETAARLGLTRPYAAGGPSGGQCPGSAEYGHGMSLTTFHGGCCDAWATARAAAAAEPEPEAG
jgi:hypothetical protein